MKEESMTHIPMTGPSFENGMIEAAERNGINLELEAYYERKDWPSKKTPPIIQPVKPRETAGVIAHAAKPLIALSLAAGGVAVFVVAITAVCGAVVAFISAHAPLFAGGALLAGGVWSAFALRGGKEEANPGSQEEWEFYQYQEQGFRRKVK